MITRTGRSEDDSASKMISGNAEFKVEIDAMNLIYWVAENFSPSDIYPDRIMEEWAKENGYVKAD